MKKILFGLLLLVAFGSVFAQTPANNTLLWRISGKNLAQPSYLFGTIHLVCADDLELSDSLVNAIRQSERVYLELDMDNIFEMLQAVGKMKMRGDTTLADLLTPADYDRVRTFFDKKGSLVPFAVLETYKPMLAASTLMQSSFECERPVAMEQLIMQQAKKSHKKIKGLESMSYQLSIFDSIPYTVQARELLSYIDGFESGHEGKATKEYDEMVLAYRNQQLDKLEALVKVEEIGSEHFTDLLLYNRNANWVKKLEQLLPEAATLIAVGAGHLPGDRGIINLLRKAGYKVEPVENNMIRKKIKEI
ncbi:TraB/GumN family protein [Paraflavisolibacter sp. H34]|uniref:TraB/GumN family protein n=1 Tax=Huijunlia imazamoxiresistens TaxID=3127457 RepID=UPI00301A88E6